VDRRQGERRFGRTLSSYAPRARGEENEHERFQTPGIGLFAGRHAGGHGHSLNIEVVTVGDPGNVGEWSGASVPGPGEWHDPVNKAGCVGRLGR
jgi:hypothetical protein